MSLNKIMEEEPTSDFNNLIASSLKHASIDQLITALRHKVNDKCDTDSYTIGLDFIDYSVRFYKPWNR